MSTPTPPGREAATVGECGWTPAPVIGLGLSCPSCRPHRHPDPAPQRWLDGTARPNTAQLARACTLTGYEQHTATLVRAAEVTRRARHRAQQLFPYGLGPVLGDLKIPADGGGDMLRALADLALDMVARRRPPRVYPVCPWGSSDSTGCGRDSFGRLTHDRCRTPTGPVPDWRSRAWAIWCWSTAQVVDSLPAHLLQSRPQQAVDAGVPRHVGKGMIGPITLLIGRDGPAQRARVSSQALNAIVQRLAPSGLDFLTVIRLLHRQLEMPRGGPYLHGWRGYAPRSLFTAALQARHASLHQGPDDVLVEHLARFLGGRTSRSPKRIAQGLLHEGWDDQVHGTDELEARLRAAVHAATSADTELWEHEHRGQRVQSMDKLDLRAGVQTVDGDLPGHEEEVERVLAKLSPAERKVADCYAADRLTWKQAALEAGQQPDMGERVRRKIKRLGNEDRRRRNPAPGSP
ncbi:hypothetical protein ACWCXE_31765 [Streptomyces sp. NPDC001780]